MLAISVFAVVLFTGCAVNEEKKVRRVDDQGYLYYIDYDKDYYSSEVIQRMRELGIIDPGCSSFFTDAIHLLIIRI